MRLDVFNTLRVRSAERTMRRMKTHSKFKAKTVAQAILDEWSRSTEFGSGWTVLNQEGQQKDYLIKDDTRKRLLTTCYRPSDYYKKGMLKTLKREMQYMTK